VIRSAVGIRVLRAAEPPRRATTADETPGEPERGQSDEEDADALYLAAQGDQRAADADAGKQRQGAAQGTEEKADAEEDA
jgi:hypothetical protein